MASSETHHRGPSTLSSLSPHWLQEDCLLVAPFPLVHLGNLLYITGHLHSEVGAVGLVLWSRGAALSQAQLSSGCSDPSRASAHQPCLWLCPWVWPKESIWNWAEAQGLGV